MTPPMHEAEVSFYHQDAEEPSHRVGSNGLGVVNVNVHQASPPSSPPVAPPPIQNNRELEAKLQEAESEILRLRALLVAVPDPSSTAPESVAPESVAPSEFRHRSSASSEDDGMSTYYAPTEVGTMVDRETIIHQDGVPLQVVIIIALGVFITTYLFF